MSVVAIVGSVVGLGVFGSFLSTIRPLNNYINQVIAKAWPNELLPPANLINLRYRGHVTAPVFYEEMAEQGISKERAENLYKGSEVLLNGYEIINLWRRDVLTEKDRDEQLQELGFTAERIDLLTRVTAQIPSAMDVISFAVREVYSPAIAEKFGQYEGVEGVLDIAADDISATGMTPETFTKYWAAHWQLPSMRQAYEMLHRDVVDAETVDQLMVALDIMPFWRDKLRAISYAPYTRVDVRRMHKLGIVDEAGLARAYMDLGYDENRAKGLAEFTVLYNLDPEAQEQTEEDVEKKRDKEATTGAVIKAFQTNLITEDEARAYLGALAYKETAVDLYIANAVFAVEEDVTDDRLKIIHEAFVRRIYDYTTTVAKLGELNLPGAQVESLMERWTIEKDAKTSRPSKAELFKMHEAKVITTEVLKTELEGHGYTDKYIGWYMKFAGIT
ncbi:hypothetical protein ES703_41628 [subsurface metagenome]